MTKVITDTDFITYTHLDSDEYQLVYSILYIYGKYDYVDYIDECADKCIYNHLLELCEHQFDGLIKMVKVKQWVMLLDGIIEKLKGYDQTTEIVVPFCSYASNIGRTIKQYQFVRLLLLEMLQRQFQDLNPIEGDGLDKTNEIPSIEELFEEFFNLQKELQLPVYIYSFLYNEIMHFYTSESESVETLYKRVLEHIETLYEKELNGEDKEARDFLKGMYSEKFINRIPPEARSQITITFAEWVKDRFECWVLPFSKYVTEETNGYFDLEEMMQNELERRYDNFTDSDTLHKLYMELYVENTLTLPSYKTEVYGNIQDYIVEDENCEDNEENIGKEKKHGDDAKNVGLLYYLLCDYVNENRAFMTRFISCILGKELPSDGKIAKSSIYTYLGDPTKSFSNSRNYIKDELEKYKLKVPDALLKLFPKKIEKFK
ncbi:MAG: hypothetical protein IJ413_09165 [Bacteroides sp.]|nr:hypothetical protein [Bacteroides sp.]